MGECSAPGSSAGIRDVCVRNQGRTTKVMPGLLPLCGAAELHGTRHYYHNGRHLRRGSNNIVSWLDKTRLLLT